MRLWWVPPEFNALQHFQPMGSAICLSADRERALRETPAALSLLVSLSATEDLSRLGAIIILALKEERGDTDEARWSERGGNAEEAWHCTRDFCRPAAVCNNGCLAAGAEVVGVGAWGREGSARGRSARAAQRQREN